MLKALLEDAWSSKVFLVPTGRNPLKAGGMDWDLAERRGLMRDWLAEVKREVSFTDFAKLVLVEDEMGVTDRPSFTVDTIELLEQAQDKDSHWILAVGGDTPRTFAKWKNVEKLFRGLHSVWIFRRFHEPEPLGQIPQELRGLTEFRVMPQTIRPVSATSMRALLLENREEFLARAPLLPVLRERIIAAFREGRLRL